MTGTDTEYLLCAVPQRNNRKGKSAMDFLCEHVVERKKEGFYRFKKTLILLAWIIFPLLFIAICFGIGSISPALSVFKFSLFLIPLFVFLGLKIAPINMAYGDVSYEYSLNSGTMDFSKIYGLRFKKDWFSIDLTKVERCAPVEEMTQNEKVNGNYRRVYKAVSSDKAKNRYYAIFRNDKDERCIAYFEVIKKSLKMIKMYHTATVMKELSE